MKGERKWDRRVRIWLIIKYSMKTRRGKKETITDLT